MAKDPIIQTKWKPKEWEKIFFLTNPTSNKKQMYKINK